MTVNCIYEGELEAVIIVFLIRGVWRRLSLCIQVYAVVRLFITLKGVVHPKMKILSSFTHPKVVPNLCVFICSAEHKGRYLEECFNQTDLNPH